MTSIAVKGKGTLPRVDPDDVAFAKGQSLGDRRVDRNIRFDIVAVEPVKDACPKLMLRGEPNQLAGKKNVDVSSLE